jgi:hypothetical protein
MLTVMSWLARRWRFRARRHQATQQIGYNEKAVAAVRGGWRKRLAAHGDEAVLTHKPLDALGVYNDPRTPKLGRDAPVAIESVTQAEQLDMARQFDVGFAWGADLEAAVVTRARKACELAEMLNVNFAVR